MLGGLLCPLFSGRPIYLIDGWDPPTVLDAMVEEQISAGSGSTYFFTSLLDCPGLRSRARRADALRRAGRLAHPRRGGRAGRRARDLARARLRVHRAPLGDRVPARAPQGEAHPHRRPAHGRGSRCARSTRRATTSASGEPGEILTRGPDRFAGYTDPALTAEAIDADGWFRTGDVGVHRRRRLPHHHRPGEGHHHPRRRERQRSRGRAVAGPHGRRGRGRSRGRARRAVGRARVRVLPHAGRRRRPGPRGRARHTSAPPAWPARSGPRSCGSSRNCPGRRRARCRSSSCANDCAPAADRGPDGRRPSFRWRAARDGTLPHTVPGRDHQRNGGARERRSEGTAEREGGQSYA